MNFDNLLQNVGDFGFYQKRFMLAICLCNIPSAFHSIQQVFTGGTVAFSCSTPEFEALACPTSWNLTAGHCEDIKRSFLIPTENENCLKYASVTTESFLEENGPTDSWPVGECDHWVYDRSQYKSTVIQEWNLVCNDSSKPSIAQSIYFIGVLFGSLIFGSLADRFGRRPIFIVSIIIQFISSFAASFSQDYITYVCLRFITGMSGFGAVTLSFIICTEWVGPRHRKIVTIYFSSMWAIGYMLLAVLAYFIRTWRTLSIVTSLPGLVILLFFPFTPESARWYLTQHKVDDALKALKEATKVNGNPDLVFDKNMFKVFEKVASGTILDLFKTCNLRRNNTLAMMFNWFACSSVYYGLSLSTSSLGVNEYIAFWISGFVEIPACVTVMPIINRAGRRWSLISSMFISGMACILIIWTPIGSWMVAVAMVGKFSVTFAFALVYLFAAEIFPTPVRAMGVGICSTSAIVGGILAPLMLELYFVWEPLYQIIFGALCLTAALLALLLPETNGQKLPETVDEAENLGKLRHRKHAEIDIEKMTDDETKSCDRDHEMVEKTLDA